MYRTGLKCGHLPAALRGSDLHPYFATPHGDMMISGCFGLLRAFGEVYPASRTAIEAPLA